MKKEIIVFQLHYWLILILRVWSLCKCKIFAHTCVSLVRCIGQLPTVNYPTSFCTSVIICLASQPLHNDHQTAHKYRPLIMGFYATHLQADVCIITQYLQEVRYIFITWYMMRDTFLWKFWKVAVLNLINSIIQFVPVLQSSLYYYCRRPDTVQIQTMMTGSITRGWYECCVCRSGIKIVPDPRSKVMLPTWWIILLSSLARFCHH